MDNLWIPKITFLVLKDEMKKLDTQLYVKKLGEAMMSADMDELYPNETYSGSENEIFLKTMNRANFICTFTNIRMYPFGEQNCSIKLFISGTDNMLTNLKSKAVAYKGPLSVGQYVVRKWSMESGFVTDERVGVTITVQLGRNMFSIIMVTYLPTTLMNIINQVTNYVTDADKYGLVITVNITCMMVLASVYLSVSGSLPTTAAIKPVEIWLLFNLAYPFLVIIINILLQVK